MTPRISVAAVPLAITASLFAAPISVQAQPTDRGALTIAAYDAVIVGKFADDATEKVRFSGDTSGEIARARQAYQADLATVRENFSAFLLSELKRSGAFAEVVSEGQMPTGRALSIDGEITKFDRGNPTMRLFVGLGAGRLSFEATLRIKDASTGTEIERIEVDRGSGLFGGVLGMALSVEYFMQVSAARIASKLRNEKCAVTTCDVAGAATVAAPADADSAAKQFLVTEEQCAVYFYISLPRNPSARLGVEVWSDESPVGSLDDEAGFFVWTLEPGRHEIFTRYLSKRIRRSLPIDCVGGTALYVHHDVKSEMIEELSLQTSVKNGQREVRKRQLLFPQTVQESAE
jgi:hypothetical protein